MATEQKKEDLACTITNYNAGTHAGAGAFYGLGFVGALIYFIQTAGSFWLGVLGVLKAIIWPALLVYQLLVLLKL